jgi:hypothetical protein
MLLIASPLVLVLGPKGVIAGCLWIVGLLDHRGIGLLST